MPFDFRKQIITAYDGMASAKEQALIEGTALLPGVTGNAQILYTDAQAEVNSAEVQNDRLAVGGTVVFDVLYTGDENRKAAGTRAQYAFSHVIDLKGARPGMQVGINPRVETISAVASGSKASLKAVLTLEANAFSVKEEGVLEDIAGEEIFSLQKTVNVSRETSRGRAKMLLEAEGELPFAVEAEEIVFSTSGVRVTDTTSYDDRLSVEGELCLDVFCLIPLTDKPIARSRHVFPFETQIPMDGLVAGKSTDVSVEFTDAALSLVRAAEDAPKTLRVEGVLTASAVSEETTAMAVLDDAFSTAQNTANLERKVIPLKTGAFSQSGNDTVKTTFSIGDDMPKIGILLAVFARPVDYEITRSPKVNAAGALEVTLVYMPDEGILPVAAKQELPFEVNFDFAIPENAQVKLKVRDADATQTASDQAELRIQLSFSAKADVIETTELVVGAEQTENVLPEKSSISIYFAKEGDTLWSVAKNYLTPVDTLRRFNPELGAMDEKDGLSAGDRTILFRKGAE